MIQDLAPKEFQDYLVDNEDILIDVREQWEFDICQIKGAILMPMGEIAESYVNLNKDSKIALYCHSGIRSMHVADFLLSKGFQSLANLQGGIDAWAQEIDTTVERY
jgi:rhodanese-related sulfurtransferase